MASPNSDELFEVEYISGVTAAGTVSATSFASWNRDTPATYGATSDEAKWGANTAGTGGSVTVAFDPRSNWTPTEQGAFVSAMHLWSNVANIHFNLTSDTGSAGIVISRSSDKAASETTKGYYAGTEGTYQLGTMVKTAIAIDTSVAGFGPIGGGLAGQDAYAWMTAEHEIGHAIGLGHGGPYNADKGGSAAYSSFGIDDTRAYSLMAYEDSPYGGTPTTPMLIDVMAAQRIYGVATDSPLSAGGQVFGFNANITGNTAKFYDFSVNTIPHVTIWDGGSGNTIDLSGFSDRSIVDLADGSSNTVGGISYGLTIAFGTRIETIVGGGGDDQFQGNALNDVIQGGGGADTLTGGIGNDHIYGNTRTTQQGAIDGADRIVTGGGNDYVNGNAGHDVINASSGDNRLYGGAGNDTITGSSGSNHINGNAGDDVIAAGGNDVVFGGQGDDRIHLSGGTTVASGDLGNDHFFFSYGFALVTGGQGNDVFEVGRVGQTPVDRTGALAGYIDEITDFHTGGDVLWFPNVVSTVLHDAATYGSVADARTAAQALLNANPGHSEVAAIQIGSDTYLFWNAHGNSDVIESALKLDGLQSWSLTPADFSNDQGVLR